MAEIEKGFGNFVTKPSLVGMKHSPKAKQEAVCGWQTSKPGI